MERKLTSGVAGDLHPAVMKECMSELAHPVGVLLRDVVSSHTWPFKWKLEHQIIIPKVLSPQTKDDLRNLGLSVFFSKCLESVLVDWLWPVVSQFISRDQYGGQAGCGTYHYFVRLVNYIYTELDRDQARSTAVAAMAVDLSKAFNRLDHCKLITMLYDMNVPVCALCLLYNYL